MKALGARARARPAAGAGRSVPVGSCCCSCSHGGCPVITFRAALVLLHNTSQSVSEVFPAAPKTVPLPPRVTLSSLQTSWVKMHLL